ncbi:MAG: heavy metal translocating P-type ATPase metal-binding domain-containing protein [Flavobacteriales bacterium]|jgi:Cu+-exporting ATPase|nr:heavy metal translocating P-type ATPase metal-binding domain-containing protein [Flavobacteriales bacterium]
MEEKKAKECYHCGSPCEDIIVEDKKNFCCTGCVSVYKILNESDMCEFYDLSDKNKFQAQIEDQSKFAFLKEEKVANSLLMFKDQNFAQVEFYIPNIHCSSCIWLLENLQKLDESISWSRVNFTKKMVHIQFKHQEIDLFRLVNLLNHIAYAPKITLDSKDNKKDDSKKKKLYKLGIAGFFWGNIMFLALPEYLTDNWVSHNDLRMFFQYLSGFFAIPVMFYSGWEYFESAYKGIRSKYVNIDFPIALGLIVIFLRSWYEVISQTGTGYFDSLTALVFFLLLGKMFQDRTYHFLSFDRDYKSYFPIAVTKIFKDGIEKNIPLGEVTEKDLLLIRNDEIVPADSILSKGEAYIDNSFVTGESTLIQVEVGDKIFAGGRQKGASIEVIVENVVDQSYLTKLWSHDIFQKNTQKNIQSFTDRISKYFTLVVLLIATIAFMFWFPKDPGGAFQVVAAVLIVACPCALALAAPFTHGNILSWFSRNKLFVKDALSVERMSEVTDIVFDKTGTLTISNEKDISCSQEEIEKDTLGVLKTITRQSNHPVGRMIYDFLPEASLIRPDSFVEASEQGATLIFQGKEYKLGLPTYLEMDLGREQNKTRLYWSVDGEIGGFFQIHNHYRADMKKVMESLKKDYRLHILSGDNEGEKERLDQMLGKHVKLNFNQSPHEKLEYIQGLQQKGRKIAFIGDGLNDAGGLQQSEFGMSISENINSFSPACDAILDAEKFQKFTQFMRLSRISKKIIYASFVFSFAYNIVGLAFAIAGKLSPIVSAILMPISSISIVVFVTLLSTYWAKKVLR